MPVYELINPSDPYTFEAPDIEHAGVAAAMLSPMYGAQSVENPDEETPLMFGWDEWLKDRGIDEKWIDTHAGELAKVFESFLIGSAKDRQDVLSMLQLIPEEKRKQWRDERQNRHRSSLNKIGEKAYQLAEKLRAVEREKPPV